MSDNEWDKDNDSIKNYTALWGTFIGTDTIYSSTWIVPSGITKVGADTFTDTTATIWLTGGTIGNTYEVVNRITTVGGITEDQTLIFHIVPK
jgi:hypothetical protein